MPVTRAPSQRKSAWPAGTRRTKMANSTCSPSPQATTRQRMARRLCESAHADPDDEHQADEAREPAPGRLGAPRSGWALELDLRPGHGRRSLHGGMGRVGGRDRVSLRLDRGMLHGGEAAPGEARDQPRRPDRQCDHRDGDEGAAQTSGAGTTACQHGCSVEVAVALPAIALPQRRQLVRTRASSACRSGQGRNALAKPSRMHPVDLGAGEPQLAVRQPVLVGQRHAGHEPAVGAERDHQPRVQIGANRMLRRPGHRPGLDVAGDVDLDRAADGPER